MGKIIINEMIANNTPTI